VTPEIYRSSGGIEGAVAAAAGRLSRHDRAAQVFFERRLDLRVVLTSMGRRERRVTPTAGVAITGTGGSTHQTADGLGRRDLIAVNPRELRGVPQHHDLELQVERLGDHILASVPKLTSGLPRCGWRARLTATLQEVWVGTPGGPVVHDARRGISLELGVTFCERSALEAVEELNGPIVDGSEVEAAFARAIGRAEQRRDPRETVSGPTTALFAPGVAGIIVHELIGHALEGDAVVRGGTWLSTPGLRFASRAMSICDDPHRGRIPWSFDDEGVAAERTALVEKGTVVGRLLDKGSAQAIGLTSNGHGRRASYLEPVIPRMGCTFIEAGEADPREILGSTREGVFIRRLISGHTDPRKGRASFVVTDADRLVDGSLGEPLKTFVLELDGRASLDSIDRIGYDLAFDRCAGSCIRDGQPLAVSVGAPTIRIGVVGVHS
jgi:predicted Zn-dependent protease